MLSRDPSAGPIKERTLGKLNVRMNSREDNQAMCPSPMLKVKASRAPRSGSMVAANSASNVARVSASSESWEQPQSVNKSPTIGGANNRKRSMPAGSSSPPITQWVGQRPQKISRTRRTNLIPVSAHDDVQIHSEGCSPSDFGPHSGGTNAFLPTKSSASGNQNSKIKTENVPSPARLSESEESGACENRIKEKGVSSGDVDEKDGNTGHNVGPSAIPMKKNKIVIREEGGDGVRRQGRSGRVSPFSRASISPTREKLDNVVPLKPPRNARSSSDKNGSKSGRPLKKLSDRKGFSRLGHMVNGGSPDCSVYLICVLCLHIQIGKKKLFLDKLCKSIQEDKNTDRRDPEQVAMDKLVELAYKKLLATRGSYASKHGIPKVSKQVALAFAKRTLARCRKFEDSGTSCFSEPALRDIIFAAPPRFDETELLTGAGLATANDGFDTWINQSDQAFAKNGPISNRAKRKELLLDDVGGAIFRASSALGILDGAKGKRTERDRNTVVKAGRSSMGSSKGERKAKTKPKQKTGQLSTSANGLTNSLTDTTTSTNPNNSGNKKKDVRFMSSNNAPPVSSKDMKESVEFPDLPLNDLEVIEELGVDNWLSLDGLQEHDAIGLDIPMDDLAELNMF
ncbi:hypothetical protein CDL12_00624 [Handroanthus impetiginosus]|uniref:Uncharacterized protein n=1 Tax=Handroanthus impetiginosus TaxID=429701 RepID=A0A2G9IA72_9LAMI|nr:hypothetical protein CDL12_00624 [Handroanthus impetiginosus]